MLPVRPDPPRVDVVCGGSAAERGAAQGAALQKQIQGAARALFELEALRMQRPWWLPLPAFVWMAERRAAAALRPALSAELPEAGVRLQAMSAASGVPLRRLALLNALEPVLSDLSKTVVTGAETACSALAVGPARSGGRGAIVAHNFDYLPLVQPFYCVRDERPAGRLRSLQFTAAPLAGVIDGLNEAGLAVTYNYAFTTDGGGSPAPTLSMRLGEVLAECRTVAEAIAALGARSRWGSGLIMLADAAGDVASLEISRTLCIARRAGDSGVVSHANRYCSSAGCAVQIRTDAVHGPAAPAALRGRRVHASSEQRETRLRERTRSAALLGPDEIAAIMSDHGAEGVPSADTLCMHSDYWHTTACVQLLPAERRLRIAYAPACAAQYVEFSL